MEKSDAKRHPEGGARRISRECESPIREISRLQFTLSGVEGLEMTDHKRTIVASKKKKHPDEREGSKGCD